MSTYIYPILGGLLIGASSILLIYFIGRVAGISGIFWDAVNPKTGIWPFNNDKLWRWLFLIGLPLGTHFAHEFMNIPLPNMPSSDLALVIPAGFLVGFGVKMGSGCTSGHGVCGIGRLSLRSLVATMTFIAAGIFTVLFMTLSGWK